MIVTTSATTVTTITYLSLPELISYKKQFESFWLPFMEQFIPATTIWVAGERWCNEICEIEKPCSDFDLLLSNVQIKETRVNGRESKSLSKSFKNKIIEAITNDTLQSSKPNALIPKNLPNILPIKNLGLTTMSPITINLNVDISSYRSKFTDGKIETIRK